jgi:hypothetical protein
MEPAGPIRVPQVLAESVIASRWHFQEHMLRSCVVVTPMQFGHAGNSESGKQTGERPMKQKFLMTVAAAALIAGTGFAAAQGTRMERPDTPAATGSGTSLDQPKGSKDQKSGPGSASEQRNQTGTQRPAQGAQRDQDRPGIAQDDDRRPQGAQNNERPGTQPKPTSPSNAREQSGSAGTSVTLNAEQRTKIRETVIQKSGAPRVSSVNFSVRVGTVVPRERVRLVAVPPPLVEIHPAWRGYLYFVVGDQLVVVEPSSHRIVAVLDV